MEVSKRNFSMEILSIVVFSQISLKKIELEIQENNKFDLINQSTAV